MSETFQIDNFETVKLLGRGGMAAVWKARQSSLDRFVAIKVLSSTFATDPADIARFRDEARAAGRLKHPGIVQVYDANFNNGSYYFVMELVDGYTVGEWIRRRGRLTENDALTVAESVIAALDYAWTEFSIIHCDIKPENIMVDADGSVKTTDLGLARAIVTMQSGELEAEVLGTPSYMSPEQVGGQPDLDCRADIYALGATLYHMVTGKPLFDGATDDEIMQKQLIATVPSPSIEFHDLSHGFVLLLAKMLAKDRKYRPQDWKSVLEDIERVRKHRVPSGHEPPPGSSTIFIDASESDDIRRHAMQATKISQAQDVDRGARRTEWIRYLFAGSVLLVVMGVAVWWFCLGGSRPQALGVASSQTQSSGKQREGTAQPKAPPLVSSSETLVLPPPSPVVSTPVSTTTPSAVAAPVVAVVAPKDGANAEPPQAKQILHPQVTELTEEDAFRRVAGALLKEPLIVAMQSATDIANDEHHEWPKYGKFWRLQILLGQALEKMRQMHVKLVESRAAGSEKLLPREWVKQMENLPPRERFKLLKSVGENDPGAILLKAVWAYRAYDTEHAQTVFSSLPAPVGVMLAQAVDENPR